MSGKILLISTHRQLPLRLYFLVTQLCSVGKDFQKIGSFVCKMFQMKQCKQPSTFLLKFNLLDCNARNVYTCLERFVYEQISA